MMTKSLKFIHPKEIKHKAEILKILSQKFEEGVHYNIFDRDDGAFELLSLNKEDAGIDKIADYLRLHARDYIV